MNWRWRVRMPLAVDWYLRYSTRPRGEPDFQRCSGLVRCTRCGYELYDHPPHPTEPDLTITCDGALVKL